MTPARRSRILARFLSHVRKTPSCWLWTAAKQYSGYGRFWDGSRYTGAHQYSYRAFRAPIPSGKCVCHTCDNPSCVNPKHLWVGTQRQNLQDMFGKSRQRTRDTYTSGPDHHNAKLTAEDVITIRAFYQVGRYSQRYLATVFGVTKPVIRNVVQRKGYKNVP